VTDAAKPDHIFEAAVRDHMNTMRVRSEAARRIDAEIAEAAAESFVVVLGSEVEDQDDPPPEVCQIGGGRGLFYRGLYNVLFGAKDAAKTWLAYIAVLEQLVAGYSALVIDYEMGSGRVRRRLIDLGATKDELGRLVIWQADARPTDSFRKRLADRVRATGAPLGILVIDSLDESMSRAGLDPQRAMDVAEWVADLPRWANRQWASAAVVAIDHVPHGVPGRPAGSARKGNAATPCSS
jgi:hypothetical protein